GGSKGFGAFIADQTSRGVKLGLSTEAAERLARFYGSNVGSLHQIMKDRKQEQVQSGLPLELFASLEYALNEEMTFTPMDFWIRRTGALFFDISRVYRWKEAVHAWMGKRLNWTEAQSSSYKAELDAGLEAA
ncbi:glycerol-3-phosphate dehydrogenase, partial [Paenibacillus sepulcri]|nr:glycerol-3-phosphate dehydrogenase [Paenibacillus sepulcri]